MDRKICFYLDEVDRILQGKKQFPVTCEIDLSNKCQNNCKFCMFKAYRESKPVELPYAIYLTTIQRLAHLQIASITFTGGGEPLMHSRFEDIVKDTHELGFEIGLITNGVELDKYLHLVPLFRFVRVSLDAATSETYREIKGTDHFDNVLNSLREIVPQKGDTTIGLSYAVCQENRHGISLTKRLALDLGVDYVQFKPSYGEVELLPVDVGEGIAIKTPRYEVESLLPCAIAGLVGIICADGGIYYCCQKRGEEYYYLGNIHSETFEVAWGRRKDVVPNLDNCVTCRYMNYAEGYKKFSGPKYRFLRHRSFL